MSQEHGTIPLMSAGLTIFFGLYLLRTQRDVPVAVEQLQRSPLRDNFRVADESGVSQ
jgi:hypothetical protein